MQQLQLLSASTKWDRDFESTDTYSSALNKGYLNALGITGTQYTRFNGAGGAVADPTTVILSGSFKTIFQNALKSYLGTGTNASGAGTANTNIWSMASAVVKCTQKGVSCYTNQMIIDSSFSTYMCPGDLDMAWRNFRQMYLDTKRHLIDSMQFNSACSSTPSPATLIATYHQPNFGDAKQALINYNIYTPITASDTTVAKQKAKDAAAASYSSSCLSYATYWFQQLSGTCAFYPADSINNVIIPRLIAVCTKGADLSHPYGSSTISPDSSNAYKSFQEVIQGYNTAHGISNIYCNAYVITTPKPYNSQSAYSALPLWGRPDSCTCTRVTDLYYKYQGVKTNYATFADYLQQVYNTSMTNTDLNTLLSQCSINGVTACTYSATPIQLPAILQCNTGDVCITCTQFKNNNDKFKSLYPGIVPVADSVVTDSTQLTKNKFYASYMNYQLGFVKTNADYQQFASDCSSRLAQDSINNLTDTCKRYTFIKNFGGAGADVLADIKLTLDGGYIMAGNTTSFGNGGTDAYVIKTDNKGNIQWSKTYGGILDDNFSIIRKTADSGYIAIGTTKSYHQTKGEIFVVKMKPNGEVTWSRGYGAGTTYGELGYDIIQTSEKGYALTGLYDLAAGVVDLEVIKLDSAGGITWSEEFGGLSSDNLGGLLEDADTLVMGGFTVSSGNTRVGGGSPPNTVYDALLVKLNKGSGAIIWARSYDLNNRSNTISHIIRTNNGYRLEVANSDDYSSINHASSNGLELDRNGNVIRNRELTNPPFGVYSLTSSANTFDGGYIAVQYRGDATGDVFFNKVDASGNVSWSNQIKKAAMQYVAGIVQNADSSFAGVGVDGTHGYFVKTNRLGKTFCSDSSMDHPGTTATVTVYNLAYTPTTISIGNPTISVVALAAQTTQTDVCSLNPCTIAGVGPTLCGRADPVLPAVTPDSITNCTDSTFFAVSAGKEIYNVYKDSLNNVFDSSYRALCMQAYKYESFTVTHPASEYHYTLYYYDQAGSLLRTVPPAGVDVSKFGWSQAWSDSVTIARNSNTILKPAHSLKTNYRYNTLGQVITQNTPDAGDSRFWYDRLGRLVISRNKKQAAVSVPEAGKQYSYTQYDYIGRITEVGQITNAGSTPMTDSISRSQSLLTGWVTASVTGKEQITSTIYDLPYAGFTGITPQPTSQRNLRNRVSYTTYTIGANPAQYNQGSFFTYDALGNVDTLLQDYGASDVTATQNGMNRNGSRFKKMVYQFDLISGKVNSVAYQANQADQFYHRYTYDAENRLTLAETSSDSIVWERDARYQYYKHGPLARTTLGDQLVQGIDYAYTLQGWLKGVNGISVLPDRDMGRDGNGVAGQNQNQYVAKDAFGFSLNYFSGDYSTISPISVSLMPFPNSTVNSNFKGLYNGNIGSMAVNINGLTVPGSPANAGGGMIYNYTYDQLNRLTAMDVYRGLSVNLWTPVARSEYKERITYDANGNILKYLRNGNNTAKLLMDSLNYKYYAGTNRLSHVRDSVPDATYASPGYEDIDNEIANSYTYDSIGNLIKDSSENISNITWNVYGKITAVAYSNTAAGTLKNLYYYYDASGNRMGKRAEKYSSAGVINSVYTWYVRDASGNVMATYSSAATGSSMPSNLALKERHVYGSSRLGILSLSKDVKTPIPAYPLSTPYKITLTRGYKFYELANHLGNVLVTLSDKKPGHSTNGTTIDYYDADQVSATDYYPFGSAMPSRSNGSYRYGFNGKEKEKDGDGGSLQIDYGFRIYDPHLGRFKSVDPLTRKYPYYSPYQFAGNMPIRYIDLDGLEPANNPKAPGVKEIVGKTIVKEISIGTSVNNAVKNPNTLNPIKIGDKLKLKGQTVRSGTGDYITDTEKKSADKFNMYVSNSSVFKVDESNAGEFNDYEAFVVNELMQNMVSGKGPENYEFPTNGIMSSKFFKSDIVQDALKQYRSGSPVENQQFSFGAEELAKDTWRNGTPFNITGLIGSGTITIVPNKKGIFIKIFNVTSLTSGSFGKEAFGENNYPKSYVRDPQERTTFGNTSETFNLFIPNFK